jgi:TonB-dependent starch-binding outer membrane protein SusC
MRNVSTCTRLITRLFTCAAFFFISAAAFSQQKTVKGKVSSSSEDGQPVQGATVTAKKSKLATSTAADGTFSLLVPSDETTLTITSVGFEPQDVAISASGEMTVSLVASTSALNEVVVIGYGTQKRRDVTGAISSVTAATIEKVPVTTVDQALQGRMSGVQIVNNDASPGGNVSVLIRGIGSLANGGNAPLYVVDGYPITGGINNINPNDIASIDVLKDASATAIYGIRAANGVVVITTKRGAKNKMQISLDAYTSVQTRPKQYDLLNAQQFGTLSAQVDAVDVSNTYTPLPIWNDPSSLHTVDWQDAMYRASQTQNYTLGIRGGSDKVQTAMSVGYYNQKGIVLGSYFKRFNVGLNLDYQPTSWLKSNTSVKYAYQDANNPFGTGQLFNLVINPPTLDGGNPLTHQIKDGNGNYGFYHPTNPNVFKFGNPVYSVETNEYENITQFVLATSSLEVEILKGLKLKTNAGVNINNYSGSFFSPEDARAYNLVTTAAAVTKANYSQRMNNNFEWLWENTIAYDRTFGDHTINFVGGVSAQKNVNTMMGASGNPPNNTIRDLAQLDNLVFDADGNGKRVSSLASEFARITYQFDDKYMITGTIRRDGSSKFDTGHKYATFPSGAVAWRIKNEKFMQDVYWIDDLKIRASFGKVGNQIPIDLFQYQQLFIGNFDPNYNGTVNGVPRDNFGYPFNKAYQNGIGQVQPANPNLKWETDEQLDIGFDAAFLDGALTLTVDWFQRDSKDFLLRLPASPQTGYNFLTRNVGSMRNKGIEIAVNYRGKAGKDFNYGAGLTFTSIKNTLTSLTSQASELLNFTTLNLVGQGWNEFTRSRVGGPVGQFYGYQSLGIFQTQAEIDALNAKAPGGIYYRAATRPGDRYFADINGDGVVNANDRIDLGNPQPKFFAGLNLDATYKSWDFNLYFYGTYGNKILNYLESHLESFQKRGSEGVQNVSVEYFENYWRPDRPSNKYARASHSDENTLNNVPSSAWVEDGSFLRLKNLTVGYTLPAHLLNRFHLSRVRFYVSSQNLFTITKYSGMDPEIGMQGANATQNGIDNGTYPASRFFTLGLNLTF